MPLFLHLLSVGSELYPLPRHLHGEHLQAALLDALATLVEVLTRPGALAVFVEDWHWADNGSRAALVRVTESVQSMSLSSWSPRDREHGSRGEWPAGTTPVRLEQLDFAASDGHRPGRSRRRRGSRTRWHSASTIGRAAIRSFSSRCASRCSNSEAGATGEAERSTATTDATVPAGYRPGRHPRPPRQPPGACARDRAGCVGHRLGVRSCAPGRSRAIVRRSRAGDRRAGGRRPGAADHGRADDRLPLHACADAGSLLRQPRRPPAEGRCTAPSAARSRRRTQTAPTRRRRCWPITSRQAEDWPAAIRFGRRAAARAIALSQFADALATLDQVLEWVKRLSSDESNDLTADLLLQQERLCETLGLRARQQEIIDALIAHLAREGTSARLAEAYLRQGDLSTLLKRFDAADRALGTALRIAQERGDTTLAAQRLAQSWSAPLARGTARRGARDHRTVARARSRVPRR